MKLNLRTKKNRFVIFSVLTGSNCQYCICELQRTPLLKHLLLLKQDFRLHPKVQSHVFGGTG